MVTCCANETCGARSHTFSDGRIFHFELTSSSVSAFDAIAPQSPESSEQPRRQVLRSWLCGDCAGKMTLILEPARGLKLVPVGTEKDYFDDDETPLGIAANNC